MGSVLGLVGSVSVYCVCVREIESEICNFCFSVAARANVLADPSLRYTSVLLGR